MPRLVSALVEEMWNSANVSFALCPMLTRGAIEALELKGSEELKRRYLPKLTSGEWAGTMVLTEPQAGSDLSAVRTRAVPQQDGTYRLEGQKIFITYGDHDLAENIVHLVLARTPDAPEGVKGISLFVVPKFLVNADGSLGARNDVRCVSLEHKLGIHASPTAVLAFGDKDGAVGWLVGEENRGLEYMFITMNAARFSVGLEGIGLSERAYQLALAYARERTQGTELGTRSKEKVAIVRHPDVRRMLLLMKSRTEAARAIACVTAAATDTARCHPDAERRARSQAFVELMIPIVKAWSTDNAIDIASLGIQVHGGMGFIEETGAAQYLRDARITSIYEGTNGIQAADLIGRKVARDGGEVDPAGDRRDARGRGAARAGEVRDALGDRRAAARRHRRARAGGPVRRRDVRRRRPQGLRRGRAVPGAVRRRGRAAGRWPAPRSSRSATSRPDVATGSSGRSSARRASTPTTSSCAPPAWRGPSWPGPRERSRSRTTSSKRAIMIREHPQVPVHPERRGAKRPEVEGRHAPQGRGSTPRPLARALRSPRTGEADRESRTVV